jgi:hypothetical protein
MRYSIAALLATLVAHVSAHGLVTQIQGANGVDMPGLSGEYSLDITHTGHPADCVVQ